jgi:hypothetical protein
MDPKQQALDYIKNLGAAHSVTRQEVLAAYDAGAGIPVMSERDDIQPGTKIGIAEILYYIGGGIVFLGICILIWQNWSILSFPAKALITLGGGIAAYIVGVLFGTKEKLEGPSNAFFLISALVMPLGLYIIFDHAGYAVGSSGMQATISFLLLVMYLASLVVYRKPVFALFSILFGTWFFYSITDYMVGSSYAFDWGKFYEYRALLSGIVYLLFGYAFAKNKFAPLTNALYGFGILGFLGAALALGGWKPEQNAFWELIFPLLAFGTLYTSVYLKSRAFLVWGTIFLMVYILKITGEYFTAGLGWPFALVLAGLLMIGAGYLSVTLNQKYLKTKAN